MRISVITIAYRAESVIQRTIESVLHQTPGKYELEYLIIDGGSDDKTVEIARSYEDGMREKGVDYRIISEKDNGIYDAMNKGIRLASGDVIGILNSGDAYEKEMLTVAEQTFERCGCDLMFANLRIIRKNGSSIIKKARLRKFQTSRDWNHPTTFVRADLYKANPFPMRGIHDDYGFYLKMRRQRRKIVTVDQVLADFYLGGASNERSFRAAKKRIHDRYRYCYRDNGFSRWYFLECVAIEAVKMILQ